MLLAALRRAPLRTASASFSTSALRASPPPAAPAAPPKPKGKAIVSSLNAGAKMEGLSVFKDVPDPVALPEDQYPNWLWTLLDKPKGQPVALEGERNFMAERKSMRDRNRANIKAANFMKTT